MSIKNILLLLISFYITSFVQAQQLTITIESEGNSIKYATIKIGGSQIVADSNGVAIFNNVQVGDVIVVSAAGYNEKKLVLKAGISELTIELIKKEALDEVVVSGTLRAVKRSHSPVPVEIYTPVYIKKNPTPDLFSALQLVNGVRPQLNCSVCNTGDIHINGLEGPYTAILIDGMPVMSSLASVYSLSAIPVSMINRIEIVKGPASSLYGSEAIGGLINVITKTPDQLPLLYTDVSINSWKELNTDVSLSYKVGKKASALTSFNYFNYSSPADKNHDNFTDVTLQNRISFFNKINFHREENNKRNSVAIRLINEDRWGGEMNWNKFFRGGDSIYGESIQTRRLEIIGGYDVAGKEAINIAYSLVKHIQESAYGTTIFDANQVNAFARATWDKKIEKLNLLSGVTARYQFYDDNTPATQNSPTGKNRPEVTLYPGVFSQADLNIAHNHQLLAGIRWDYNNHHGNILTPRIAYKWQLGVNDILRLNAGTGFRMVNIFTEDHAALTGAREVVIAEKIKPEKSINLNLNYVKNIQFNSGWISLDASAWLTKFSNKIAPDYSNTGQIIYANLNGYAISKGISLNANMSFINKLTVTTGFTLMDLLLYENPSTEGYDIRRQLLTEKWSGTWAISYSVAPLKLSIDYTGNIYGPMQLPLASPQDPRDEFSPVFSIQNIQLSWKGLESVEIYGGIKNLLNFTPAKHVPFLIARTHDPFNKKVLFDNSGNVIPTAENKYALTFDPSYIYASNQGVRTFLGIRYSMYKK